MEKWGGWRRGAQCDWVGTATEVEAAMMKTAKVKAAVVRASEVKTTVKIAALAAMAAKN